MSNICEHEFKEMTRIDFILGVGFKYKECVKCGCKTEESSKPSGILSSDNYYGTTEGLIKNKKK